MDRQFTVRTRHDSVGRALAPCLGDRPGVSSVATLTTWPTGLHEGTAMRQWPRLHEALGVKKSASRGRVRSSIAWDCRGGELVTSLPTLQADPMQAVSSIASSGMTAAARNLGSAGHNLANLGTTGFKREVSSQESLDTGGVTTKVERATLPGNAIEADIVSRLSAKHLFLANLAVFRTSDAMTGTLLDMRA